MRDEFEAVKRLYAQKLHAAESSAAELQARYRRLQTRRARDLEGFSTDVCRLRRALAQLETQWALVGETAYGAAQHGLSDPGPPLGVAEAVAQGQAMHAAAAHAAYPSRPELTAADRPWRVAGGSARDGRPPQHRSAGAGAGAATSTSTSTSFRPSHAIARAPGGRAVASGGLVPGKATVQAAAAASGMRVARRGQRPARTSGAGAVASRTPRGPWQVGDSPSSSPLSAEEDGDAMGWSGVISQDGDRDSPLEADGKSSAPAAAMGASARGTVDPPALPPATASTGALGKRWEADDIRASLAQIAQRTGRLQSRVGQLATR
jgi:hypothetical protein